MRKYSLGWELMKTLAIVPIPISLGQITTWLYNDHIDRWKNYQSAYVSMSVTLTKLSDLGLVRKVPSMYFKKEVFYALTDDGRQALFRVCKTKEELALVGGGISTTSISHT